MKIALDASLLGARFSGVERSVGQLLAALPRVAEDADQFDVYVGNGFDAYCAEYHPDGFDPAGRLNVVRTGVDNGQRLARIWFQQVILPRLVHQSGAEVFHGPASFVPAQMRTPSVVTLYDLLTLDEPGLATCSNRLYYRTFLPAGVRRAERVIVPSAHTRRAVAQRFPDAHERTVTIPLGVAERFAAEPQPDDEAARALQRLPQEYLLWVGNVEPKKNLTVLLSALALLKRRQLSVPKLVLAGPLSWGTNDLMRQFLADQVQDKVIFLGRVPDRDLPALYRGARGFVFPSVAEGFGLPLLEAMACGVPVLAADDGALPEVLGEAGGLLPPHDAEAWAEALWRLTADEEWRKQCSVRGLERVQQFGWSATARATLAVYRTVALAGAATYDHNTGALRHGA